MVAIAAARVHRPTVATARPKPVLLRECERTPNLFDLPELAPVEPTASPIAGTDAEFITLDMVADEAASTARFARAAKKAVAACQRCPFLQQCQRESTEQLYAGQRPQGEVRGAVAFDAEGLPAAAVHHRTPRAELDQFTLDEELGLTGTHVDVNTDWVPADLPALDTHDAFAITLAMDERRADVVVTQSLLDAKPTMSADGRIVLSYTDELVLLRDGLCSGQVTKNRLKQIVDTKWERIAGIAHIFGYAPEGKYAPTPWEEHRRALSAFDSAQAQRRRSAAHREQYHRDLVAIRRDSDHDRTLDLADRCHATVYTGPAPLSSRICRTTLIGEHHVGAGRFTG